MRFPFNQSLRFQLTVANGTAFSKISKKKGNLIFFPEYLELSVEWFAIGNSNVLGISGNFSGKFLYQVLLLLKFSKVLVEQESAHWLAQLRQLEQGESIRACAKAVALGKGVNNKRSLKFTWLGDPLS